MLNVTLFRRHLTTDLVIDIREFDAYNYYQPEGHNSTSLQTQPKVFTELIDYLHQSPEILIDASKTSFSLKSSYPLGGRANDDARRYYVTHI